MAGSNIDLGIQFYCMMQVPINVDESEEYVNKHSSAQDDESTQGGQGDVNS